jgi:hypothetical protein
MGGSKFVCFQGQKVVGKKALQYFRDGKLAK